ncbi:hypothetical protein HYV81_06340, partial [Candidatus Woesearchaeota archaeon]|nr:hypothetical protein [Candidatus Woesearchaeota archaeon]
MKRGLLIILLLLILPLAAAEEVSVSTYILNLGEYSQETGSFKADFYLHFKCEAACNPETFEFINGRASSITLIEDLP